MDSKPSTPLSEQSDKKRKYDRQLRLWGDHGQQLLENANILVCGASGYQSQSLPGSAIGASSVLGSEILRSLVLPGIGTITIIDDARITQSDHENNLMINGSIGSPRGENLLENLLEMNNDVCGTWIDDTVPGVLKNNYDLFQCCNLVVAVNLEEKPLLDLSEHLWKLKIPLIVVKSYGMIGYIRIQAMEFNIIESHPESELPCLCLYNPTPSIKEYFDNIDLDKLDDKQHSHVPYVVILYKYLQKWIKEKGSPPSNYKERKLLGQMIREGMREKSSGESEENFEEAIKAINTSLKPDNELPRELKKVFDEIPLPIRPKTSPFWRAIGGLKEFFETNGRLPVTGVLPDMTADSASYVTLQNLYREQAHIDSESVRCLTLNCSYGSSSPPHDIITGCYRNKGRYSRDNRVLEESNGSSTEVTESLVKSICRHAASIRVIQGKSVAEEYKGKIDLRVTAEDALIDNDMIWYILLRAVDQFYTEYGSYPGFKDCDVEDDVMRLKACVNRLIADWRGISSIGVKDDHIQEMCRYGNAQIHSVASFVGGCAAHEVIKIVTKQYVPVDNTVIYNATSATTTTLKL